MDEHIAESANPCWNSHDCRAPFGMRFRQTSEGGDTLVAKDPEVRSVLQEGRGGPAGGHRASAVGKVEMVSNDPKNSNSGERIVESAFSMCLIQNS
jgi:hypothetical protein